MTREKTNWTEREREENVKEDDSKRVCVRERERDGERKNRKKSEKERKR